MATRGYYPLPWGFDPIWLEMGLLTVFLFFVKRQGHTEGRTIDYIFLWLNVDRYIIDTWIHTISVQVQLQRTSVLI